MATESHHRRLEAMYAGAPCHRRIAPTLRIVADGRTELELDVIEELMHAARAVHGSYVLVLTASFNVDS